MIRRRTLVALTGAAALAAAPALAVAATSKKVTIGIFDNYYSPSKKTVKANTSVRWRWDEGITDVHDVKLVSAPKGVKKFQTEPLAAGQSYTKKLTRPGLYTFVCSFHEDEMKLQLRVAKAAK